MWCSYRQDRKNWPWEWRESGDCAVREQCGYVFSGCVRSLHLLVWQVIYFFISILNLKTLFRRQVPDLCRISRSLARSQAGSRNPAQFPRRGSSERWTVPQCRRWEQASPPPVKWTLHCSSVICSVWISWGLLMRHLQLFWQSTCKWLY